MGEHESQDGGSDKRRAHRMRVLKSGRIVFNGGYTTYDCRVRNLSSGGALLQMPSLLGIPNSFEIDIDNSGQRRPCTVMWRSDTQMGVKFDDAPAADAPADPRPRLRLVETAPSEAEQGRPASVPALKSA